MHYSIPLSNKLFLLAFMFVAFPICAQEKDAVAQCMDQGKTYYATKEYELAKEKFTECIQKDASHVEARLSLAGVFLTQDDLDKADTHFRYALSKMKKTSPYLSYTYSMLGDIALKRQKNEEALKLYAQSLVYNPANVNSLVGKGVILEYEGDKKAASELYRSALAVEPLNLIARKRLINLEPEYFTDDELLAALKQRYALSPSATEISLEDRELFSNIHQAEQRMGVSYLKNKYPKLPSEYVVVLNKDTDFEREILTLEGYKALRKQIGQDAIAVFQKVGVPIKDVFSLRDMKGNPVFAEDGTLTESGYLAYTAALKNQKKFLLPKEDVPPTPDFLKKAAKLVEDLKEGGYTQITPAELKMLKAKTNCSEETMRKHLGLYVLQISKNDLRYFIISRKHTNPKKGILFHYLAAEHAKRNPNIKVPPNSLAQSYSYYNFSICLDDGNLVAE